MATDLFSKFDPLIAEREALLATGVRDPYAIVMEKVLSPTEALINGKKTILLGTYNYMGMTFDPDVIAAGKAALDAYGAGTTGSRVLNGTYQGHKECEDALKEFYGTKHAIVFSTGYQANLGMISTLAGKGDYIILDADSHASIYDGCWLGDAEIVRFRHNSVEDLDKRLGRLPAEAGKLVVLEGVYSMMGDIAPLPEMVAVAKKHGAMILCDEAHGMGFFGEHGRGVFEEAGVADDIDFVVGTFSKSVGTVGGFCVSNHPKFEVLRLAAAVGGRDRCHLDPQADARGRKARPSVEEFAPPASGAARHGLQARYRDGAVGDHRGNPDRHGPGRRAVAGASRSGPLRQHGTSSGNACRHLPAALLALCRAYGRAGRSDPGDVRKCGPGDRRHSLTDAVRTGMGYPGRFACDTRPS